LIVELLIRRNKRTPKYLMINDRNPFFYVTDPNTGREVRVRSRKYLDLQQTTHMGWRPDMVRQFACFLANKMPRLGPEPLRVQVRMYVSVNGRKPRIFLDPNPQSCRRTAKLGKAPLASADT
jgi:hypothetical protein